MNHIEEAVTIIDEQLKKRIELYELNDIVMTIIDIILTHDANDEMYDEWLSDIVLPAEPITFEKFFEKAYANNKVTNKEFLGVLRFEVENRKIVK